MGYELCIERENQQEISLEEWTAAVEATENVRITNEEWVAVNPSTGDELRMKAGEADAEVFIKKRGILFDKSRWVKVFTYRGGRITFASRGMEKPDSSRDPIRKAAAALAAKLDAMIAGEEGEVYDW